MTRAESTLAAVKISKAFGAVQVLSNVSIEVRPGRVTCLLGDNGAGKSTLIKILSGTIRPDAGTISVDSNPVSFGGPRDALAMGIAAAYQDLALVPVMPIYRNFCLGAEPVKGAGVFRRFDAQVARTTARQQLAKLGIDLADVDRPVSTLSGGQRQALAIARAVHAGASVLILDEPTAALGQSQSQIVLDSIETSKAQGIAILLVTHNSHHAFEVGDNFVILAHGSVVRRYERGQVSHAELVEDMWGS
jgi:simple sugar transport system ATP-binding protein